jgi:hypothetical protein
MSTTEMVADAGPAARKSWRFSRLLLVLVAVLVMTGAGYLIGPSGDTPQAYRLAAALGYALPPTVVLAVCTWFMTRRKQPSLTNLLGPALVAAGLLGWVGFHALSARASAELNEAPSAVESGR